MLGGQTFPGIDAFSQERTPTLAVFICNQQTQPASPVVYTNRQKHLFRCNHKKVFIFRTMFGCQNRIIYTSLGSVNAEKAAARLRCKTMEGI